VNLMSPSDIVAKARQAGVAVALNNAGTGLSLSADGDLPPDLVELVKGAKPEIVELLKTERRLIDRWVANQIISRPPDSCRHCRRRVLPGQPWVDVRNGEATSRFHAECVNEWRLQQEAAARKALGFR
jgi:hypothetical protein